MTGQHPIQFIESLLVENTSIGEVQFSVYNYHPQSTLDDSRTIRVDASRLRPAFENLVAQLNEQQDVAFNSIVRLNNSDDVERHFALLDFQTGDSVRVDQACQLLISECQPRRAALVSSGRLYHLYLGLLLSRTDWVKFMGRCLLLNTPDESLTVDDRWIGHRLIAGYGALRWSARGRPKVPNIIREW